jgi:hypothetical protein
MKNIYEALNEVEIDLSMYEEEKLSILEEKRIMNNVLKNIRKNGTAKKKRVVVAVITFLLAASSLTIIANPTFAQNSSIIKKFVSKFLSGNSESIDNYVSQIGQSKTINGAKITLKEVVLDNNALTIAYIIEGAKDTVRIEDTVYINGKELKGGGGSRVYEYEDENKVVVLSENGVVGLEIPEVVDLKISTYALDTSNKTVEFNMTVSKEKLNAVSNKIKLDKVLNSGIGTLKIKEFSTTPINTYVTYETDKITPWGLIIKDKDGKYIEEIGGQRSMVDNGNPLCYEGVMRFAPINEVVKEVTVIPYLKLDKINKDLEPMKWEGKSVELKQGDNSKIIISSVEKAQDKILVKYKVEGLAKNLQSGTLKLFDENKNEIPRAKQRSNTESFNGEITEEFQGVSSDIYIGASMMDNILIFEELQLKVQIP